MGGREGRRKPKVSMSFIKKFSIEGSLLRCFEKKTENYLCGRKGDKLSISSLPSDRVVFPIFLYFYFFFSSFSGRMSVGKLQPPVIPFMPLLLKDMTFAHEGNKTSLDGLVNFEKMHMMAQTMRSVRFCRSRHLGKENIFKFFFFVLNCTLCQGL